MMDRAIGMAGIALAIIGIVAMTLFPKINRKLAWAGFIGGVLLLGVALGMAFLPNGEAQTPTINGNCNNVGNNNFNCNVLNIGPKKRSLSQEGVFKAQLLSEISHDKTIAIMVAVNDGEAYNFATEIYDFMKQNGFKIKEDRVMSAIFSPPIGGVQRFDEPDGTVDIKVGKRH